MIHLLTYEEFLNERKTVVSDTVGFVEIKEDGAYIVTIVDGSKTVGTMDYEYHKDTPEVIHLGMITIEPQYRGKGYGSRAVRYLIEEVAPRYPKVRFIEAEVFSEASKGLNLKMLGRGRLVSRAGGRLPETTEEGGWEASEIWRYPLPKSAIKPKPTRRATA